MEAEKVGSLPPVSVLHFSALFGVAVSQPRLLASALPMRKVKYFGEEVCAE